MNLLRTTPTKRSTVSKYATVDDFRKCFAEGVRELYLLSYLLTGNCEKAEQCVVAGLDDCVTSNFVFKEWVRSWTRRAIVQNAVRMIKPHPDPLVPVASPDLPDKLESAEDRDAAISSVLALREFDRFVFVISVLEGYSEKECSVLVGRSQREVRDARIRALQQISNTQNRTCATEEMVSNDLFSDLVACDEQ